MSSDERLLLIDDLVYANVGVEIGLNVFEHDDGTVSASTSVAQSVRAVSHAGVMQAYPNWPRASIAGENAMASWNVRRKDSCASSAQALWKSSLIISSRMGKRAQQAALVAVFMPSAQATRLVSAAVHESTVNTACWRTHEGRRTGSTLNSGRDRDEGEQCFERHGDRCRREGSQESQVL